MYLETEVRLCYLRIGKYCIAYQQFLGSEISELEDEGTTIQELAVKSKSKWHRYYGIDSTIKLPVKA